MAARARHQLWRRPMVEWCDPDLVFALVYRRVNNLDVVARDIEVLDRHARQQPIGFARRDVDGVELEGGRGGVWSHQAIRTRAVGGQARGPSILFRAGDVALRGDRALGVAVVNPQGVLTLADRRNERPAVRRDGNPFFFRRTEGDLLGAAVWKPLPPQMRIPTDGRGEIHPAAVRRPAGRPALAGWTHLPASRTSDEGHETARLPVGGHFHDQHRLAIG